MTRSELIKKVTDWSFEITQSQADHIVSTILEEIVHAVDAGERVELRNFGTFFPRHRAARMGRNPKTGEVASVPARRVLFFKAGKNLKNRLNGKKAERKWTDER